MLHNLAAAHLVPSIGRSSKHWLIMFQIGLNRWTHLFWQRKQISFIIFLVFWEQFVGFRFKLLGMRCILSHKRRVLVSVRIFTELNWMSSWVLTSFPIFVVRFLSVVYEMRKFFIRLEELLLSRTKVLRYESNSKLIYHFIVQYQVSLNNLSKCFPVNGPMFVITNAMLRCVWFEGWFKWQ